MKKKEALLKLESDLEIRRYSLGTVHRYTYVTERFLDYMKDKSVDELDEYDAIKYLNHLTKERYYKASSYNNINAILKFFLEVTLEKNIGYKRIPNAKVEIRKKVIPDKEVILKIMNETTNLKHKCWYSLAYGSGLRVCEISKLKVGNISSRFMKIKLIGKGNKERITVLPKMTLDLLRKYVKEEGIKEKDEYLFKGRGKDHISSEAISRSLRDLIRKLDIDQRISVHSFRRSFITHMLIMGEKIEVVKELVGHRSITTTMGYADIVYEKLEIKNPLDSESYE